MYRKLLVILPFSLLGLFFVGEAQKPGIEPPSLPDLRSEVLINDELLKITSYSPERIEVQNVSDKLISGFSIEIFAAEDDLKPLKVLRWGHEPIPFGPVLTPNNTVWIPGTLTTYGRRSLHVEVTDVMTILYSDSAPIARTQKTLYSYKVIQ